MTGREQVLRRGVQRIEAYNQQIGAAQSRRRGVYAELAEFGIEPGAVRDLIRERKTPPGARRDRHRAVAQLRKMLKA